MILLELFKGTGSVSAIATEFGYTEIISLDIDAKAEPTICCDILELDYTLLPVPDFLWASPPCNTYSTLAYKWRERNPKTASPYSARAQLGTDILSKTIEIIEYFQRRNPFLRFVIENPRGMMRNDFRVAQFIRNTTYYSHYGDPRGKPTDFFSNFEMNLIPGAKKGIVRITDLPLTERYKIPPKLLMAIFAASG